MKYVVSALFFVTFGTCITTHAAESQSGTTAKIAESFNQNYIPGMGEIMGATQMRHSKLWFAGQTGNWELAGYELDEIKEGLDDAIKYHPLFKKDAPVAAMLDKFMAQPLDDIGNAIKARSHKKFRKSFDDLTSACNECHQAAGQEFIVIKRPGISPYSNQEFAAKLK